MDKRLLFTAMLAASIGANEAQAIELSKPVLKNPLALNPTAMTGTDTVYIYNVKADKWLNNGNAWGTQTVLAETGMKVAIVPNKTKDVFNGTFSLWDYKAKNDWKRIFMNSVTDEGGWSFADHGSQPAWKCNWVIYPKGNSFELQADTLSANQSDWDEGYAAIVEHSRAGWNPSADETDEKGDVATYSNFRPALNMNAEGASEYGVEWQAYSEEEYLLYSTRVALKKAIEEAEGVDLTSAINVYNNQNATSEELVATLQLVKDLIRNTSMEGADINNPADLTQYLTNANCDNLSGWDHECEYDKDGNVGSGGHGTNWQAHDAAHTSEDGTFTTSRFIERWIAGNSNPAEGNAAGTGHLSDGVLSQKLTNLPKGAYRLSCYAMATQQDKGDDYEVEGVSLFAQTGSGVESAKAVATKAAKPKKFEFLLYLDKQDDLTIGFKLENTTANWVFVDEFKLEYCGPDEAPMYLQQMNDVKEKLTDAVASYAYEGYLEEANAAIGEADGITSDNTPAEIQAQTEKIQNLVQLVNLSIEKYLNLQNLNTTIQDFISEGGIPTEELDGLMADCGNGTSLEDLCYATPTLDNDALDAYVAKLNTALNESRKNSIAPGADVTYKIQNPSFTDGNKGWTDPKTVSGDFQNCEAYQATFDMYQEITDLPAGVYKLTAQAFHRVAGNDVASADGDSQDKITAVLYANDIESKFASPYSYGMAAASGGNPADWAYTMNGEEKFIPNSMQGFKAACDESEDAYLTTVYVLVSDGKLRIGVRETVRPSSGGDWAIWDNFHLTFVGNDNDAIRLVSGPVIAQAEAVYNKPMAATELNALKTAVEELKTNGSAETIKAVTEATKAASASASKYETLNTAIIDAENRYELNELTNKTSDAAKAIYTAALNTAKGGYENGTIETADVPEAINALRIGITQYVVCDAVETGTAENPADVSNVIVNHDFSTMDATGWTYEGNAPVFQASNNVQAGEFYNRTYNMKQEIIGLPAGVYYLKAKGFYREGNDPNAYADEEGTIKKYEQNEKAFVYFANNAEISETATENKATVVETATIKPIAALQIANKDLNEVAHLGSTDGLTMYAEGEDESTNLYIPNNMVTAQAFFNSTEGEKLVSEPVKIVYDGTSKFFIGIYKTESVGNDWTIFKDFTLQYAGKNGGDGINDITGEATGDTIGKKIYNAAGVMIGKLQKGINIVVSTLSDGTKKVSKVIVK